MVDIQLIREPLYGEPPRNRGDGNEYVGLLQVSDRAAGSWRPAGVSQVLTQHVTRMPFIPRHHLLSGIRDFSFGLELLELLHLVDPPQWPCKHLANCFSAKKRAIEVEYYDSAEYLSHENRYKGLPPSC
jgi:hypothetical protein